MICSIIYVGEAKDDNYASMFREYQKMLKGTSELEEIRVKPYKTSGSATSESEIRKCIEEEGKAVLSELNLPKYSKCEKIAMCIEGKNISSEEFAELFQKSQVSGKSGFAFVIGGSWGLSDEVKKACDIRLSFSKMTFPHRLFKVMLAEQIYRAFSIIQGKKYHK